jgi:hypothetical protein
LTSPTNPHYRGEPEPHAVTIPVLGIPVEFSSNDSSLIDAVRTAFAVWTRYSVDPHAQPVRARFILHDRNEGGARDTITYRLPDDERVFIHTRGSLSVSDPLRREVNAYVTRELVNDRDHFRYGVLEAAIFGLLTQFDRQPFHAAAIVRGESVLLLYGPSGAGKSTLTYAAMQNGFNILAEDMVYLQSSPRVRVWGVPSTIHLNQDARTHFPELETASTVRLANSKEKIAVRVPAERAAPFPSCDRAGLCVVGERAEIARIERIGPDDIEAVVRGRREEGFDVFDNTIGVPLRDIAAQGGWKLTTSPDPRHTVSLLHEMFDALNTRNGVS